MDLKKQAVVNTAALHLLDAGENPMYDENEKGDPDHSKPCRINVYSPGSKQYANANARRNNRGFERLRSGKKSNQSADEQRKESAQFLADCTHSAENLTYGDKVPASREDFIALYSDLEIGFIAEQVGKFGAEWSNFRPKSQTS